LWLNTLSPTNETLDQGKCDHMKVLAMNLDMLKSLVSLRPEILCQPTKLVVRIDATI
jgi:hypothetical protein